MRVFQRTIFTEKTENVQFAAASHLMSTRGSITENAIRTSTIMAVPAENPGMKDMSGNGMAVTATVVTAARFASFADRARIPRILRSFTVTAFA